MAPDVGKFRARWRAFIEALLPWYDVKAARQERAHSAELEVETDAAVRKLDRFGQMRAGYKASGDRLSRPK